jgi:hypothetical protein
MKKNLREQKKIIRFSLILSLMLICSNTGWSQTVLTETFGSTATDPYTGEYTVSGGGSVSTVTNGDNTYLNITSVAGTTTPIRSALAGALPVQLNTVLTDNTNLITWSVNLKTNRLGTNAATSYAENKYFMAVVLCASNNGIIGSIPATASDGYAIMYQKNSVNTSTAGISLIKFHNGIGNTSTLVDAQELCTASRLIQSVPLTTVPNSSLFASLSVQVIYNPNTDTWELLYRENNTPTITDPIVDSASSTGNYISAGSIIDADYTTNTTPMVVYGFVSGTQTNDAYKYQYDDFKIQLSPVLGVAKMNSSKFNAYPNPVTDGKLYISSDNNSEKKVAIFTVLGQKVLDAKTKNNSEINVSQLAKGAYILTVTEDGKSDSKKLIIQ